jgi:hypothetical protein
MNKIINRALTRMIHTEVTGEGDMADFSTLRPSFGSQGLRKSDYSHLSGFTHPSVRINPHTHVIRTVQNIDLLKLIELVRPRQTSEQSVKLPSNDSEKF